MRGRAHPRSSMWKPAARVAVAGKQASKVARAGIANRYQERWPPSRPDFAGARQPIEAMPGLSLRGVEEQRVDMAIQRRRSTC